MRGTVLFLDQRPPLMPDDSAKLGELFDVLCVSESDDEHVMSVIHRPFVVVSGVRPVTSQMIERAVNLRAIVASGAGYNHIHVRAALERNVAVCNVPGANATSVAELALAFILMASRDIFAVAQSVKQGRWAVDPFRRGREVLGKTVGIIGFGNVGRQLAVKCASLGMTVRVYTSHADKRETRVHFDETLKNLLRSSDFVVLACSLRPDTRRLIGSDELRLMKPTAYLINVARGEVVDEEALVVALRANRIAGAFLDVLREEPPRPDNPLLSMERVVVTNHMGGRTWEAAERISKQVTESIIRVARGEMPAHLVTALRADAP